MDRDELIAEIFTRMQTVHRTGSVKFHSLLDRFEVTPSQLELLLAIRHAGTVSSKDLAATMRLTPGAVSQLVEGLVVKGHVARQEDEHDRRVCRLGLTESGKKKLNEIADVRMEFMKQLLDELSTDELQLMLKIQRRIIAQIETK